ncbi:hypothetical protein PybrP1_006775 [[Pythium] brassicae (nom. inval.)]|nr:hypothetical protein PybrP1_006775 [[Pythium] brassicae (nom. inval.)]
MQDPQHIVDQQFANVAPITKDASPAAATQWLDAVGEIMGRVALGGLATLPPNAAAAVNTLGGVVVQSDSLLQDRTVLRKVLAMAPAVWTSGYWYAPIATWKPAFSAVWDKPVALTKRLLDADESDCEPYDAAVNATALMIRFTKDNYFLTGDKDTGDSPSGSTDARAKSYLAFLPEVVAQLSRVPGFALSEHQLRAYMNTLPSKRDGMDMSVAFPTYVDTARYKASDAAALRTFLSAGGTLAQQL